VYFDAYSDNKSNGAFILIDATNTTAGVGFIDRIPIPALLNGGEIIDKLCGYKFISQRIKNVDVKLVINQKK
jgi:sulfate adenylyltransferase subunit 1 (EFTu-like GTPase family)